MTGISATLNYANNAIKVAQAGIGVVGKNIANVTNPDYSRQELNTVVGEVNVFGTEAQQSVDILLENRLTGERSTQAAFEEAESYMRILVGLYNESSSESLSNEMIEFWNSWEDLSNNPQGSAERVAVYENGLKLSETLNQLNYDFEMLSKDLSVEIEAGVVQINSITGKIAAINQEILGAEATGSVAYDQRDVRNSLVNDLAQLINIETYEKANGSLIITAANGASIVNQNDSIDLFYYQDEVMWSGVFGAPSGISDTISGGRLGGWLTIRDEVIPKYQAETNILAQEMIWAVNYQHSQGTGLEYFSGSVTGDYATDASGLLSSYAFGNKIDYSADFRMWIKDSTLAEGSYTTADVDMGLSEAGISDWQGIAGGVDAFKYELTVVEGATIGDYQVAQTDGTGLAETYVGTDVAATLDNAIAQQSITVSGGPSGTAKFDIADSGAQALRSAASIADHLNTLDGVTAHASQNSATLDIAGIADAEDGDIVQFSLYVDGVVQKSEFRVDGSLGTLDEQFETALFNAAAAVNEIHSDQDLSVNGFEITSRNGRTIGIEAFEVVDNAVVQIDNFTNFNSDDTVSFTVSSDGVPITSTIVTVDLTGVTVASKGEMADAFFDALTQALDNKPFSVTRDPLSDAVILRTTDGSNLTFQNGGGDTGNNATLSVTEQAPTTLSAGDNTFNFDGLGVDTATFDAFTVDTDTMDFENLTVVEPLGSVVPGLSDKAAVKTGTVTILVEPGMTIYSDLPGAGGLFDGSYAKVGSSIITLGGDGGFENLVAGDTVTFMVDGTLVNYPIVGATDLAIAGGLEGVISAAFLGNTDYEIIRTGSSVSIIKNKDLEDPIEITNFMETVSFDGISSAMAVSTGTGRGTNDPVNDLLEAGNSFRDSSTSTLYDGEGVIQWKKIGLDGISTGDYGYLSVSDVGTYSIEEDGIETLSFYLNRGSLVAGNTMALNTDTSGEPDPLALKVTEAANSVNDVYTFTVVSGGKVGHLPEDYNDPIMVDWSNGTASGSFEIEGFDPPRIPDTPVEVNVDGMTLKFSGGMLFKGDVFTITTDASGLPVSLNGQGEPTGEILSDWHWTIDSFADQFNRAAAGIKASTTIDHRLMFESSEAYHAIENIEYSGSEGFSQANVSIDVKNWSALDFSAGDFTFNRLPGGGWGIGNDPTGGKAQMVPPGGDDDGFGVDVTSDGIADFEINFAKKVTGVGSIEFDLVKHDAGNQSFAFSDDEFSDSGLAAAAGINTFFSGEDAMRITMNRRLTNTDYIAGAKIENSTGEISIGNNENALAMSELQYEDINVERWTYTREGDAYSSQTQASLDTYYSTMLSSIGIMDRSIRASLEFSDSMVTQLGEYRDSISAVSLDEEMVKLIEYQHAFTAASKLITVSDEMLQTLTSLR